MTIPTALRMILVAAAFATAGWFGNDAWRLQQASASAGATVPPPAVPTAPPAAPVKSHKYEVRQGMEYGYLKALSADDRAAGQAATSVIMFRYAGERDGRIQVHSSDGLRFTALECERPCRVIKAMTFVDSDYLRDKVHVEHMAYDRGSVAAAVIDDALAGELRPYGMARGSKSYQVWVDESSGRREYQVTPAGTQKK